MELKLSEEAPKFDLPDQNGVNHSLEQYLGNRVLLYFYPKDSTPGCTTEACQIRDSFPDFKDLGITVLGVSVDSVASHKKFAEKYNLPFTLLADENKEVVDLYGVWQKKKMMGREYMGTVRSSFLINPRGEIAKIYKNVKPKEHAQQVLEDVKKLK